MKALKFLPIATAVQQMSKDPSTKVGAIALDENFNIISTGYNGFPRGVNDDRERYLDKQTKYMLVSHAEMNVVAQAAYAGRSLKGSTVIVTQLFPCTTCTKLLIQAGVKTVIAPNTIEGKWGDEAKWSKLMFDEAGVDVMFTSDQTLSGQTLLSFDEYSDIARIAQDLSEHF